MKRWLTPLKGEKEKRWLTPLKGEKEKKWLTPLKVSSGFLFILAFGQVRLVRLVRLILLA